VPVNDHKYFGFTDTLFPKLNKGTMVFGSMKKYYDMLMATVSTDGSETLTSDYAPGANNIPAAIFMQDTYNNGLYFGYKDKENLKNFASLYKNEIDELVFKSDSGKLDSEYSALKLHKDYLKYSKLVQFENDLSVSRDFNLFGDINSKGLTTGKFTEGATIDNNYNSKVTEVGVGGAGSVTIGVSETILYKQYLETVLVTDGTGKVIKSYKLETQAMDEGDIAGLNQINPIPNSATNILTSDYFSFLARKINSFSQFASDNYWRKNQFSTGDIPDLKLSGTLNVVGDSNISGILSMNKNTKTATITADLVNDNAVNRTFGFFKNNILVTDIDGKLLKTYGLDTQVLPDSEITAGDLAIYSESKNTLISTYHYAHLAKKLNAVAGALSAGSWTKPQFETFAIPSLYLSADLKVRGNVMFNPGNGANVFEINAATKEMFLGSAASKVTFKANAIQLNNFADNVLVTDHTGNLLNTYAIETTAFNDAQLPADNAITGAPSNVHSLPTSSHIGWLASKINNVVAWVKANYWTRTQMSDGSVANIRATTSIKSDNQIVAGDTADPTLNINGTTANLGKSNGNTTLRGNVLKLENRPNIVVTTNANGDIVTTYSVEGTAPVPNPTNQAAVTTGFWANSAQTSTGNGPSNVGKLLSSDWFQYINMNFNAIRALIFNRPTYAEVNSITPGGIIAMWDNVLGPVPAGWTICDGRVIPNSGGTLSRNYVDKFMKGSLTPGTRGGAVSHLKALTIPNLPTHNHPVTVDAGGNHGHTLDYSGDHTHSYSPDDHAWRSDNANDRDVMVPNPDGRSYSTGPAGNHTHFVYDSGDHIHTASTGNIGTGTSFSVEPDNFTVIIIIKNPA
jgi:hypothetical protein